MSGYRKLLLVLALGLLGVDDCDGPRAKCLEAARDVYRVCDLNCVSGDENAEWVCKKGCEGQLRSAKDSCDEAR